MKVVWSACHCAVSRVTVAGDDDPLTRTDPTGHSWWGDAWNGVKSAAKSTWHAVTSTASWLWNGAKSIYHTAVRTVRKVTHYVADAFTRELDRQIAALDRTIHQIEVEARKRAARFAAAARKQAKDAYDKALGLGKWAYHAAAIASFAASTLVFMGCEAAISVATGGVGAVPGAIACGAAAGAVGGAIDQGAKCLNGQKGACSAGAFAESAVLGAAGGAIGGGIGGSLGGKLAESALGDVLPKLVTNTLEGAAIGGITGGATGAAQYGLTCSETSAGCSWSGLGHATATGAEAGAIGGAAGGALFTGGAAVRARLRGGKAEPAVSEEPSGSCPVHSFTASTLVLMADGNSKPISQIKAGDKITNAVPGDRKGEVHKVEKVIVTKTDHDFVDLTIATHDPHGGLAGVGKLTTTDHHPFYDITQAAFIDAAHLKPGDHLQEPDGQTARRPDGRNPPRPPLHRHRHRHHLRPHHQRPPHLLHRSRHHTRPRTQLRIANFRQSMRLH
jgi:hypothetical protein